MRNLIQRLSVIPHSQSAQVIAFIAARSGEGTSTLSKQYVTILAQETGQKVLMIDAGPVKPALPVPAIVEVILEGKPTDTAIHAGENGVATAHWLGDLKNRAIATKIAHDDETWKTLSQSFDTIVIDAPSMQASFDGILLAAKADATVMVVEAEKTPEPVVRKLRDTLVASGAKIAGIVMNKRRHYIPDKIYTHL